MSLNKWRLIWFFLSAVFCTGRAEPTAGPWSAHQCHLNATIWNTSVTGQKPFLWQQPLCHRPLFFPSFGGLIKNKFLPGYIHFLSLTGLLVWDGQTRRMPQTQTLIPIKQLMSFFFIIYKTGGTGRKKLSGITAGCPSTPRGLMNDTGCSLEGDHWWNATGLWPRILLHLIFLLMASK